MDRAEAIAYWGSLHKTFSSQLEKEENYFGRMHLQTTLDVLDTTIAALREQESLAQATSEWVSVKERLPAEFVSVLGYMTDAGEFPPVRECYLVGGAFFFPALRDRHPVSHWMPLPEPPKEGAEG